MIIQIFYIAVWYPVGDASSAVLISLKSHSFIYRIYISQQHLDKNHRKFHATKLCTLNLMVACLTSTMSDPLCAHTTPSIKCHINTANRRKTHVQTYATHALLSQLGREQSFRDRTPSISGNYIRVKRWRRWLPSATRPPRHIHCINYYLMYIYYEKAVWWSERVRGRSWKSDYMAAINISDGIKWEQVPVRATVGGGRQVCSDQKADTKNKDYKSYKRRGSRVYSLPVVIALMPDEVVGGGLDKIVSMPCGLAAPCGPNCVCVGLWSW